jgi:hypothetical protein
MAFFDTFSSSYHVTLLNLLENALKVSKKSGKVYSNSNLRIYILSQYVHCDFLYVLALVFTYCKYKYTAGK